VGKCGGKKGGGGGKIKKPGKTLKKKKKPIKFKTVLTLFFFFFFCLDQMFLSYLKGRWCDCCVRCVFPWQFSPMWLDTMNARLD